MHTDSCSQNFIFFAISNYGSLVNITITTTRKVRVRASGYFGRSSPSLVWRHSFSVCSAQSSTTIRTCALASGAALSWCLLAWVSARRVMAARCSGTHRLLDVQVCKSRRSVHLTPDRLASPCPVSGAIQRGSQRRRGSSDAKPSILFNLCLIGHGRALKLSRRWSGKSLAPERRCKSSPYSARHRARCASSCRLAAGRPTWTPLAALAKDVRSW